MLFYSVRTLHSSCKLFVCTLVQYETLPFSYTHVLGLGMYINWCGNILQPQKPSWYKSDEKYPGIRFFGEPLQHSVTSLGGYISWWEENGVEFEIPPGAVPEGRQLDLTVGPCSSGPFQPPDDYELASPLFLISPSFDFCREITLRMGHFSKLETEEDRERMAFLSAHPSPHSVVGNQCTTTSAEYLERESLDLTSSMAQCYSNTFVL